MNSRSGSLTRRKVFQVILAAAIAVGCSSYPAAIAQVAIDLTCSVPPPLDAWDDFTRPDQVLATGDPVPSGQTYRMNVNDGTQYILGNEYHSDALKMARIAYIDLPEKPTTIWARFRFFDDGAPPSTNHGENAVIGSAGETGNGFGQGSVQIAVYRDEWRLFVVENPIVDPYPVLAQEAFPTPLLPDVEYTFAIHWSELTSGVIIEPPIGQPVPVTDPLINQYWGDIFGIQMRRPSSSHGKVAFKDSAAVF